MKAVAATDLNLSRAGDPLESFQAPPRAGTLGVLMFIAGLAIGFTWLLVGYAVTRMRAPVESLTIPVWFWFSTFVILVSSVTLHWSYLSARAGRLIIAGRALLLSTALGWVFVLLQTPGMVELVQTHRRIVEDHASLYLLVLVLVSLHGLHTLAGLGRLMVLNKHTHRDAAGENDAAHLKQMCLFWHFLAVLWVVMFGVILWA